MAGRGIPQLNAASKTHVFYVRNGSSHGDPIVDVNTSQEIFEQKSNGLFEAVHMLNVGSMHASPWDNWEAYEPYYRQVLADIDSIIATRALVNWPKTPHLPQPR
jgi:hypothetical protein